MEHGLRDIRGVMGMGMRLFMEVEVVGVERVPQE
jgi:hypothetical protein